MESRQGKKAAADRLAFAPGVCRSADGRLEVFTVGTDSVLWYAWQTTPTGTWTNWQNLGGSITSNPAAALSADGHIEVFAIGTDSTLQHIWQTPSGSWNPWEPLADQLKAKTTASADRGTLTPMS